MRRGHHSVGRQSDWPAGANFHSSLTRCRGACPSAASGATRIRAAIVFTGAVTLRWNIHGRILGEETAWLQHEAGVFDRHYRKILWFAYVRMSERVPHHDVLVVNVTVLTNVLRQSIATRVLVGEVAAGIALIRCVAGHPDMLGG